MIPGIINPMRIIDPKGIFYSILLRWRSSLDPDLSLIQHLWKCWKKSDLWRAHIHLTGTSAVSDTKARLPGYRGGQKSREELRRVQKSSEEARRAQRSSEEARRAQKSSEEARGAWRSSEELGGGQGSKLIMLPLTPAANRSSTCAEAPERLGIFGFLHEQNVTKHCLKSQQTKVLILQGFTQHTVEHTFSSREDVLRQGASPLLLGELWKLLLLDSQMCVLLWSTSKPLWSRLQLRSLRTSSLHPALSTRSSSGSQWRAEN